MKIYLDSAQVNTWKLPAGCPAIQGVTTNPSLVFQAGLPVNLATYLQLIQAAADHGFAELMLQLPTNDATLALQWLDQLRPAAENANVRLTIKLPCHPDWLPTISAVQAKGQAILLTGLSNPVQLLWAKSLKAAFVAPYVGRLVADGRDVWPFMQACVAVQNEHHRWRQKRPCSAGSQHQIPRSFDPIDSHRRSSSHSATCQLGSLVRRCADRGGDGSI